MQDGEAKREVLKKKEVIDLGEMVISAFDFIQTKSLKYHGTSHSMNQLIFLALDNGEIILRNPAG